MDLVETAEKLKSAGIASQNHESPQIRIAGVLAEAAAKVYQDAPDNPISKSVSEILGILGMTLFFPTAMEFSALYLMIASVARTPEFLKVMEETGREITGQQPVDQQLGAELGR